MNIKIMLAGLLEALLGLVCMSIMQPVNQAMGPIFVFIGAVAFFFGRTASQYE